MKLLGILLASLLALVQYPLWLGQGSWLRVWELDRQLSLQQEVNAGKRMRNEGLEAEVADLRDGTIAIEERARYELGMVKRNEIFVQFGASGGPAGGGQGGAQGGATSALSPAMPPTAGLAAPAHPAQARVGTAMLRVGN